MLFNHHIRFLLTKGIPSYRDKEIYDGSFETKFQKLGLGLNLKECTSSFAPASQQRIKRLKPTNTRLKHQSEQFCKISTNAAIPAKKYGFTKQKHIRGDKTLKI